MIDLHSISHTPSITDLLVKKIAFAMIAIVLILNLSLWFLAHQQIHAQTDAMLYQLASLEEQLYQSKEKGISTHVAHQQDQFIHIDQEQAWVEIPSWGGVFTQKYRLILDQDCKKIQGSALFKALQQAPKHWCQRYQKNLFTSDDQGFDLRMGVYQSERHPIARYYLVGIDHQNIDRSTWLLMITSVSISLFLIIFIWLLIVSSVKNISQSLSDLSDICQQIIVKNQSEQSKQQGFKLKHQDLQKIIDFPQQLNTKLSSLELIRLSLLLSQLSQALSQSWVQQESFMAIAAHELKTPLTAILGELEIALRRKRTEDEYQETLRFLLQDVERLNALTKDLLTIARLNSDQIIAQPLISLQELKSLTKEIHRFFNQQLIQQKLELKLDPLVNLIDQQHDLAGLMLNIDQNSIWHILLNLIQNSVIHSNGTMIVLSAQLNRHEKLLMIELQDDGKGIDPMLQAQIFAPFQRSTTVQGHGLGLYISKTWIQKWGGDLILKASPTGTHWCLSIQLVDPHQV